VYRRQTKSAATSRRTGDIMSRWTFRRLEWHVIGRWNCPCSLTFRTHVDGSKLASTLRTGRRRMTPTGEGHPNHVAVLLVEDDPAMRALVSHYLQRDGFAVVDAASAEAAVARADATEFDAAIIDKELPGMTGLECLSILKGRYPRVPVIVVTAFGGSAVAEEAFARGASCYLEKPFRFGDLAAALRSITAPAPATQWRSGCDVP
jgi:CheY-like chemotaxis protein